MLDTIKTLICSFRPELLDTPMEADTTIDDLNLDCIDRVELAMAIEEETGGSVCDSKAEQWTTLADVIVSYKESTSGQQPVSGSLFG